MDSSSRRSGAVVVAVSHHRGGCGGCGGCGSSDSDLTGLIRASASSLAGALGSHPTSVADSLCCRSSSDAGGTTQLSVELEDSEDTAGDLLLADCLRRAAHLLEGRVNVMVASAEGNNNNNNNNNRDFDDEDCCVYANCNCGSVSGGSSLVKPLQKPPPSPPQPQQQPPQAPTPIREKSPKVQEASAAGGRPGGCQCCCIS